MAKEERKAPTLDPGGKKPIFYFLVIIWIFMLFTTLFLWATYSYMSGLTDGTVKSSINYIRDWGWAMTVFLVLTSISIVFFGYYAFKTPTPDFNPIKLIIAWLIMMIIVNIILLGFGFYFLSLAINSTDYNTNPSTNNSVQAKNLSIAMLVSVGLTILTIIIMLIYYNSFRYVGYSGFFGSDYTIQDWFDDKIPEGKFGGPQCKRQFEEFQEQAPIIKDIEKRYGKTVLEDYFRKALARVAKITPADLESSEATE